MSAQPDAMRLASRADRIFKVLEGNETVPTMRVMELMLESATELRRLVAENEAKDALLRQAVDALGGYASCIQLKHHQDAGEKAITAIRQHMKGANK